MSGVRLEAEVHIVTGAVTSVQNVIRSVNRAGLGVEDIVLEPLASSEAVLFPDEKELGVVLIDVGGGTTDVALLREGAVWYTASLPLGGDHITNDIAIGLRTPLADAEELKKRHACASTALVPAEETILVPSVGGRKPRQLSRQVLSEIVQPRVEEIFTLVARDLAKAGFQDSATAGVVVTGGTSIMEGVAEVAEARTTWAASPTSCRARSTRRRSGSPSTARGGRRRAPRRRRRPAARGWHGSRVAWRRGSGRCSER
jgi:cell division protein FtsA